MTRAARLLDLLQRLRSHRHPVSGAELAAGLGISLRTLYRDIATLQAQGARIDGAPGLGYLLREGFLLPPLMFTVEELEALSLGTRWVAERGDPRLGAAARDALARIAAVLPAPLRHELDSSALLVGPAGPAPEASGAPAADPAMLTLLRQAIRTERKLHLRYRDAAGRDSERTLWPFALGFFDRVQVAVAWCELRGGIRHFRTDRMSAAELLPERYPRRRQALLKLWREQEGIAADRI